eukprot:COSAG02_NODE_28124_length_595_cov_4.846774_1_plen_68_part_01
MQACIMPARVQYTPLWYSNYGTSDPGGSRARGRARDRAEQPTWAHRVRYRELKPLGMFRRKSKQEPRL